MWECFAWLREGLDSITLPPAPLYSRTFCLAPSCDAFLLAVGVGKCSNMSPLLLEVRECCEEERERLL